MKKAILTFGLFSLMMILTSFTSPTEKVLLQRSTNHESEIGGNQSAPRQITDLAIRNLSSDTFEIGGNQSAPRQIFEIGGNQSAPRQFSEIGGNQSAPRQ